MFTGYEYKKPSIVRVEDTYDITAAFAGGGWLHLSDRIRETIEALTIERISLLMAECN